LVNFIHDLFPYFILLLRDRNFNDAHCGHLPSIFRGIQGASPGNGFCLWGHKSDARYPYGHTLTGRKSACSHALPGTHFIRAHSSSPFWCLHRPSDIVFISLPERFSPASLRSYRRTVISVSVAAIQLSWCMRGHDHCPLTPLLVKKIGIVAQKAVNFL
jgi:hypothetical protein